jgi:hypothetical protein
MSVRRASDHPAALPIPNIITAPTITADTTMPRLTGRPQGTQIAFRTGKPGSAGYGGEFGRIRSRRNKCPVTSTSFPTRL